MPIKIKNNNSGSNSRLTNQRKKPRVRKLPSVLMPITRLESAATSVRPIRPEYYSPVTFWEYTIWFTGVLVIVLLVGTAYVVTKVGIITGDKSSGQLVINNELTSPSVLFSALTGEKVTADVFNRRPLAVMIENLSSVRPQSGLSFADMVWEAPTEGGITRFLAIFQKGLPSKIGPVRSARPYFIDWAQEAGALYAHSGGSSEALDILARGRLGVQDVNEFSNSPAFWREVKEDAPHNLYTAADIFYKYVTDRGWENLSGEIKSGTYLSNIDLALATSNEAAREILVPYYPFEYDVLWRYNSTDGFYTRFMDGKEHRDKVTGGDIQFKNLIIMFTDVTPIPKDPLLKVNLRTIGEGPVYLFNQGKVYKGQWQKETTGDRTIFVDGLGSYLPMMEGNTWISVMDKAQEAELEYK